MPLSIEREIRASQDAPVVTEPRGAGLGHGAIPGIVAAGLGVAWVLMLALTTATQPPADPDAPITALGLTIELAFTFALLGAAAGLGMRRRWGVGASLFGGAVLVFGAVACFATGHTGAWIAAQLGAGLALSGLSIGALRSV